MEIQSKKRRKELHQLAMRRGKLVKNHLEAVLSEPKRKAQEDAFALEHRLDTDQELIEYLKREKRRLGKQMKEYKIIGHRYLVKRFGSWQAAVTRANRELEEERKKTFQRQCAEEPTPDCLKTIWKSSDAR